MKTMGWSWAEFCDTPVSILEHTIEMIEREHRELDAARARR